VVPVGSSSPAWLSLRWQHPLPQPWLSEAPGSAAAAPGQVPGKTFQPRLLLGC